MKAEAVQFVPAAMREILCAWTDDDEVVRR